MNRLHIFFVCLFVIHTIHTLPDGALDTTFNPGGMPAGTLKDYSLGGAMFAFGVYIQPDGKIVVAGQDAGIVVARYLSNGSFDPDFNGGSNLLDTSLNMQVRALKIQSDGKIVVAGAVGSPSQFAVARYLSNGAIDTTFGTSGKVVLPALGTGGANISGDFLTSMVIQSDGKIVIAGSSDSASATTVFAVARLHGTDGSLDTSFSYPSSPYTSISGTVLIQFNIGSLDFANAVGLQSDGKIIIAGTTDNATTNFYFALTRLTNTGDLDTSFATSGFSINDFGLDPMGFAAQANGLIIQPNNAIVLTGFIQDDMLSRSFGTARYTSNGALDTTFNPTPVAPSIIAGTVITNSGNLSDEAHAIVLQNDGKIIVGGETDDSSPETFFSVVRYLSNGQPDPTFGTGSPVTGMVLTSFSGYGESVAHIDALAIAENGYIVAAGSTKAMNVAFALARYISSPPLTPVTINVICPIGNTPTFFGTAQNPSIVDIFLNGSLAYSTVTTGIENIWSFTVPTPLAGGLYSAYAIGRYQTDGNVNGLSNTINFSVTTDPTILFYDTLYADACAGSGI